MTLVIPQEYGQCVFSLQWAGDPEPMAMTIGVGSDAANNTELQTVVDRLAQSFVDNMLPAMADDLTLVQTELTFQLAALPAPPQVNVSTISDSGTGTGALIPQNTAYLIHKRTAIGGRGGRGRWYVPGCAESEVDALGNVSSGKVTDLNTAALNFLLDVNGGTAPASSLCLFHDSLGAFAADPPYDLTILTCDPVVATQRRRLRH